MKKLLYVLIASSLLFTFFGPSTPVFAAEAVDIMSVQYPSPVEPGNIIKFTVTVKINSGQLLESRGDMLRNTDGNLFGEWPHIGVSGAHTAGESYTFTSYGSMVAPAADGQYHSRWRVWQNGNYVGGEADISFRVKKGSGGGVPPPYVTQNYTGQTPCVPTTATTPAPILDAGGTHYSIDLEISPDKGQVVMDPASGRPRAFVNPKYPILEFLARDKWEIGPVWIDWDEANMPPLFDAYKYSVDHTQTSSDFPEGTSTLYFYKNQNIVAQHTFKAFPGGPLKVYVPGERNIPADHWQIDIYERGIITIPIPKTNIVIPWGIYRGAYDHHPGDMVYLLCNRAYKTVPERFYYALLEGISIPAPEIGRRYAYNFNAEDWMTSVNVVLRQGSSAEISLRGPDGTIYDASHPGVEYINEAQYAILRLDDPNPGQWEVLVDVLDAQPDSVFYLSVGGTYGESANADILAPFTTITIDATHGKNSWLTSDAKITLSADDADGSGVAKIEWSVDEGATWNEYSTPILISQEGLTVFMARATDKAGNVEVLPPTKYLRIDKTPPVVNISVDQAEYTRIQPFLVHYSGFDPEPGSGLASLAGLFKNQPVTDGQTVDLFWLPLGSYTLTATGEDAAGWVTTDRETVQLIATIPSLQQTVIRLCAEKYIMKKGMCNSLQQKLRSALAAQQRGPKKAAINILMAFQNELKGQKSKGVTLQAYDLLMMDSNYIITTLGGKKK